MFYGGFEDMSLKTKANIVGTIAILCGAIGAILAFSSTVNQNIIGVIVFLLMFVYSCLKDEYRDLRCKEIDEEIKRKGDSDGRL